MASGFLFTANCSALRYCEDANWTESMVKYAL